MINEEEVLSLSNTKVLNIFLESLKSTQKAQCSKKKNNKKLFSVKVQKYEDSSSHYKTDGRSSRKSRDMQNKPTKKR